MALIFCEGFNEFRLINGRDYPQLDVWTVGSGTVNEVTGRSGPTAIQLDAVNTGTQTKLQLDLSSFGSQAGKKLYVGFAVENLASLVAARGTTAPRRLVTFLNPAGAEVLQVDVKKETSTDLNMKFGVSQTGTQFAEYTLTNLYPTSETPTSTSPAQVFRDWLYVEFEIDLVNNTFALRVNGIPKFVTSTTNNLSTFPTAISDIATLQFHGTVGFNTVIDDFYIADSFAAAGLQATLSAGSAVVDLVNSGSTLGLTVGQPISVVAGSVGAFNASGATIASISDSARFVVDANHATSGSVTFNVIDNSASGANSWYGACRILTPRINPAATFLTATEYWSTNSDTKLADNDGDATDSYVVTGTVGKKQLISCSNLDRYGQPITISEEEYIAAVQLNTVIRKTNQNTAVKPVYKSNTNTYYYPGASVTITDLEYKTRLFISPKNPATNTTWELSNIVDSSASNSVYNGFGVEIVAPS